MTVSARSLARRAPGRILSGSGRFPLAWVATVPFFAYVAVFLILPALSVAQGAFQDNAGHYTTTNVRELFQTQYLQAFWISIKLSVTTAITGGIFGGFVAYAMVSPNAPRWLRPTLSTFSGVAANFAGIPLAFAFLATFGTTGVATAFLADHGINLYATGFSLYHFSGLVLTYTYFQMPLMVLIIAPAIDGLRPQWREAATNLGATSLEYWRHVGLPILLPSLLGAMVLLFGSAFAAYATAYALVGGTFNLVPLLIGAVLSGNIESNPQFGDALALGMIAIISVAVVAYALLMRRAGRWLR